MLVRVHKSMHGVCRAAQGLHKGCERGMQGYVRVHK